MKNTTPLLIAAGIFSLVACAQQPEPEAAPDSGTASAAKTFSANVQPILTKNCVSCHSGDKPAEGLNLESYDGLAKGIHDGKEPAFVAGKSSESMIVKVLTGDGAKQMPPDKNDALSAEDVATIAAWVDAGAKND
ncbi:MAG: c-type cytochrome [Fimbriimonadaceae bacterium]|nr:c-type cytochrome [Fimbriimonadaceae bacterium]